MCSDLQFCWTARTTNKSQHPIASRVNMKSGHSQPKLNSCKGLRLTLSTRVCVIFSYLHYQSHNPHQVHQFHPYKYLLMTSLFSSSLLHLLQEDIEIVLTLHKFSTFLLHKKMHLSVMVLKIYVSGHMI